MRRGSQALKLTFSSQPRTLLDLNQDPILDVLLHLEPVAFREVEDAPVPDCMAAADDTPPTLAERGLQVEAGVVGPLVLHQPALVHAHLQLLLGGQVLQTHLEVTSLHL